MRERLFGLETELALTVLGRPGVTINQEDYTQRFMTLARQEFRHLPGLRSSGIFLQNGARLYTDCGRHPEISTPECTNPWDAVRYIRAGDRMMEQVAAELKRREPDIADILLHKCNVDYSGSQTTWGCHESYLLRADPQTLPKHLLPFLASRVVFTGAGGFNPLSFGLDFTLSPRSFHLVRDVSNQSTSDRGLFHTKDEPLCRSGYHRLHILGESLCSDTAMWLKVGATALVVALTEQGIHLSPEFAPLSAMAALRVFAADPECSAVVMSGTGRGLTATMIQQRYLDLAEQHARADFMPPWAEAVCRRWRETLERLREAPWSVATVLDWAIKRALYEKHAKKRGFNWDALPPWTHVVTQLVNALAATPYRDKQVSVAFVLGHDSPVAPVVKQLTPYVLDHGLSWDRMGPFLDLRLELFEIDTRFSQLGDRGIFAGLDAAQALGHGLAGVDNIEHAMQNPPSVGRARLRGECVKRFSGESPDYACDWEGVWDLRGQRHLDLSEPFASEEHWQKIRPSSDRERSEHLAAARL